MFALALVLDTATPVAAETADAAAVPPAERLTITVAPGIAWGYFSSDDISNHNGSPALAVDVGYRTDEHTAVGVHFSLSHLSGTYMDDSIGELLHYDYTPIFVAAFARAEALRGYLWGEVGLGLHVDDYHDQFGANWSAGLAVSLTAGVDLYKVGRDRFGVFFGVESELQGQTYEAISAGIAYRR